MNKFIKTIKNKVYLLKFKKDKLASQNSEVLKDYLSRGGNPDRVIGGFSLLFIYSKLEMKKLLLDSGADVNAKTNNMTPIQQLFENYRDDRNTLRLRELTQEEELENIKRLDAECALLLQYGANPNATMEKVPFTLLGYAIDLYSVEPGAKKIIKNLLQHGAKVDSFCLALSKNADITQMLVDTMTFDEVEKTDTKNSIANKILEKRLLHDSVANTTKTSRVLKI